MLANGSLRALSVNLMSVLRSCFARRAASAGAGRGLLADVVGGQQIESVDGVAAAVPIAQNSVAASDGLTGSRLIDGVPFDDYAATAGLVVHSCRSLHRWQRRDDVRCRMACSAKAQHWR